MTLAKTQVSSIEHARLTDTPTCGVIAVFATAVYGLPARSSNRDTSDGSLLYPGSPEDLPQFVVWHQPPGISIVSLKIIVDSLSGRHK